MSSTYKDNRIIRATAPLWRGLALLLLALSTAIPASAQNGGETLLLLMGRDTVARERVHRDANRLEVALVSPMLGVRFEFVVELGAGGVPRRMVNRYWPATAPNAAPPQQVAVLDFIGDSVIVTIENGPTQRIASERGAVPFINPSFALVELALVQMAAAGRDSMTVPAFMVAGGQTMPLTLMRLGSDSVRVGIGGSESRLRVDRDQRILGGVVPAQGLRLERVRSADVPMAAIAAPDYSAPPGAPYRALEVRIPTPMGHTLAGTLTLPDGASPTNRVPAIVTSTGSGLQDRDEALPTVPGYRLFRQVADTLSRHGIAVLRLDDRGFGASEGNGNTATSRDFADDVQAALAWLRNRPEIDPARLGIVGHSEGGLIAPLVAAEDTTLRAIVLLAGPSRTGREVIRYQQRAAIERMPGVTAAQRDSFVVAATASLDSIAATSAWIRFFLEYDPIPTAHRVRRTAVFIVQGATDQQITADQAPELEAAFRAAGNRDVTMRVFPEANHLLIQDPDGNPAGYGLLPDRAVRPDILGLVLEWVRERMR